jgi:hypothetical protein
MDPNRIAKTAWQGGVIGALIGFTLFVACVVWVYWS